MSRIVSLAVFLIVTVGGGIVIGVQTLPGDWYAGLAKPAFNPPNWIFAPVWTLLYVLIAIAGWRSWMLQLTRAPFRLWVLQLLLNFAWSPAFFGLQRIGLALAIILALLVVILVFIATIAPRDRIAAGLFVPYALWVAFATLLNASILWLN